MPGKNASKPIRKARDGGIAKPYQVRQVRDVIVKYKLGREIQE